MRKLLLICSAVSLIYGNCVWGIDSDDEKDWESTESASEQEWPVKADKSMSRLERQKRDLQRLNKEFEENQKEIQKLRNEFRGGDSNQNPLNQSQRELFDLQRKKIEKYQKALKESQRLLAEEREKNESFTLAI